MKNESMKRFAVFAGVIRDSSGGWKDFVADFGTKKAAVSRAAKEVPEGAWRWAHVVDIKTGLVVYEAP
jgi:hypothetical protein